MSIVDRLSNRKEKSKEQAKREKLKRRISVGKNLAVGAVLGIGGLKGIRKGTEVIKGRYYKRKLERALRSGRPEAI
jgi:hypothetical protein